MGANFCSYTLKATTAAEAMKKAKDYQEQERHENGHGAYSGHLGTRPGDPAIERGKFFATVDEAIAWAIDNHSKWDPPMLVCIGNTDTWVLCGWCPS